MANDLLKNALKLPRGVAWRKAHSEKAQDESAQVNGAFLQVAADAMSQGFSSGFKAPDAKRWLALFRHNPFWIHPAWGETLGQIPDETQMLLWERNDGMFGVLLPILDGDLRATLCGDVSHGDVSHGDDDALRLQWDGAMPDAPANDATLAFVALGDEPFSLVKNAVAAVASHLKTFRLREEKPVPQLMQWLGWCTWDAFYHKVDERKVMAGLRSFANADVAPGFVIIDDGWLQTRDDYLQSFAAHATKFPNGLAPMIRRAKSEFGVREFGVWHAFQGYWCGLDPDEKLAVEYSTLENIGNIRPWQDPPQPSQLALVHPRDIHRFYHDFYRVLQDAGVDFTKVDGQSATEFFTDGKMGRVGAMRRFQEALQGASHAHLKGDVIHCMCNGSDVAYNMNATNIWRNSDDYFPAKPVEVQQWHIVMNAFNNVWTGTFAIPDWDMFQSHQVESSFHAAARAISGGPIYLCDKPGKQNFDIVRKLITSDNRVLVCDRPALPSRDCLFGNVSKEARLLKVSNHCGEIGVLGIFGCQKNGGQVEDSFSPRDVPELDEKLYAAYCHQSGELKTLKLDETSKIALGEMEWEIVTLSPIHGGVAPLGLIEKYNGAAAITSCNTDGKRTVVTLRDGGEIGFYCEHKPQKVRVDGRAAKYKYQSSTRLLRISALLGKSVIIELESA